MGYHTRNRVCKNVAFLPGWVTQNTFCREDLFYDLEFSPEESRRKLRQGEEWLILDEAAPIGKPDSREGALWAFELAKGKLSHKVFVVNTSPYQAGGAESYAVFGKDPKVVREFLRDKGISGVRILSTAVVSWTG